MISEHEEDETETQPSSSSTASALLEVSSASHSPLLSSFPSHDCLLDVLNFLSFHDLNTFALVSKECYNLRCHSYLDQTRSGTIRLNGAGVQNTVELMKKVRKKRWYQSFRGNRTHLRLIGLNHLSADIETIDAKFVQKCSPLNNVTSLDCSIRHNEERKSTTHSNDNDKNNEDPTASTSSWLSRYEDYIDKGFAHGLALSLLVPNLREIDLTSTSLTSLGVVWLLENNPRLECIRWNHSLIWPINHLAYSILRAGRNLKELHLDHARLLFSRTPQRAQDERIRDDNDLLVDAGINIHLGNDHDNNEEDEDDLDVDAMWASLSENAKSLVRVSCRRARWYQKSKFTPLSQEALMKFVRNATKLRWFRSDLTRENIVILKQERPEILFCQ